MARNASKQYKNIKKTKQNVYIQSQQYSFPELT